MTSSINLKARADAFKIIAKSRNKLQFITRQVLIEIGQRLTYRSPVGDPSTWNPAVWPKGYVPGHFINNWQVGIDSVPTGIIQDVDRSGSGSIERLQRLGRWPAGHTYYFVNNLPYAQAIEHGWSKQAPRGIVKLVRMEFQSIVKEAEAKFNGNSV